jgi:hypothetical protein
MMTAPAFRRASELARNLPGHIGWPHDPSEKIEIFRRICRRRERDETILTEMKPFSGFGASRAKPPMVINLTTTTAHAGHRIQRELHAHAQPHPCFRFRARRLLVRRLAGWQCPGHRYFPVQRLADHDPGAAADRGCRALLIVNKKNQPIKAVMLVRFCAAAFISLLTISAAQAQVRSPSRLPDPRTEFVRQCAPRMLGRWEHPEEVCGCLHDHAAAVVEDRDLREALLRGISETGVPTIETDWVPAAKQTEIGPTFTKIAKPTLQCMFDPAK